MCRNVKYIDLIKVKQKCHFLLIWLKVVNLY